MDLGPEPEWPLIMPCDARKDFIFSRNSVTLLFSCARGERLKFFHDGGDSAAHPHPVGTLCTKAETLEPETDAGLAGPLSVGLLVAFLFARSLSSIG